MAWSPRELADLAGTSRRAVRAYDAVGLLARPERQFNGYQQYGVQHLLQLLRIRRLRSLGLTLPQIGAIGDADRPPPELLRSLDARLHADMERLRQTRLEIAAMLEHAGPSDLPVDLAARVGDLPPVERALVTVLSRLLTPPALDAYVALLGPYRVDAAVVAFDHLPDDADRTSRHAVAVGLAEHMRRLSAERPRELDAIDADVLRGPAERRVVVGQALADLYSPAQRDVLAEAQRLLGRTPAPTADAR